MGCKRRLLLRLEGYFRSKWLRRREPTFRDFRYVGSQLILDYEFPYFISLLKNSAAAP